MATSAPLRRALLYGSSALPPPNCHLDSNPPAVPASSPQFIHKAATIPAVDTLVYDLEDSVAPDRKAAARDALLPVLRGPRPRGAREVAVRVNSVASGLATADLAALLTPDVRLDAVVLPKADAPDHVRTVADALDAARDRGLLGGKAAPRPRILALIESARAVMDLKEICRAAPGHLAGLIFAAEDFAKDLGITRTQGLSEFLVARSTVVLAAKAYRLDTIDLVCTDYKGPEGRKRLAEECQDGKNLGFGGKQCIHPDQVAIVQEKFSPGSEEIEWAVKVIIANDKAAKSGRGAWTMDDGKMIDAPVIGKARDIVAKAKLCGIELWETKQKWKDFEPS